MSSFGFQSLSDLFVQPSQSGRYSRSRDAPPIFAPEPYVRTSDTQPLFASNPVSTGLSPSSVDEALVSSSTSSGSAEASNAVQNESKNDADANKSPNIVYGSAAEGRRYRRQPHVRKSAALAQYLAQNRSVTDFVSLSLRQGRPNPFLRHASPRTSRVSRTVRGDEINRNLEDSRSDISNTAMASSLSDRDVHTETAKITPGGGPDLDPPTATSAAPPVQQLTHVTSSGEAYMVDVGEKPATHRVAIAFAHVRFTNPKPLRLIYENNNKKGDVLGVSRIAGIMAAKRTSDLIPLCHPLAITKVEVDVKLEMPLSKSKLWSANGHGLAAITAQVECVGPTGVEMEALTAVSAAALTVIDMCKAVDSVMFIGDTRMVYKTGGRTGTFVYHAWHASGGKEWLDQRGLPNTYEPRR